MSAGWLSAQDHLLHNRQISIGSAESFSAVSHEAVTQLELEARATRIRLVPPHLRHGPSRWRDLIAALALGIAVNIGSSVVTTHVLPPIDNWVSQMPTLHQLESGEVETKVIEAIDTTVDLIENEKSE